MEDTQQKRVRKAIITDAGFASRYLPITKTVPKAMLPLGNKPIMQLVVEECVQAGIEEIIIVATPEGEPIYQDYFHNSVIRIKKQLESQGKLDRYEPVQKVLDFPKIVVITQDPSLPYGNGSPVASAQKFVEGEEAFLVMYSDDVVFGNSDAKALVEKYNENPDVAGVIMAQEISPEVVDKYGIISFKEGSDSDLDNIIEKPDVGAAPSNLASYGRYLVKPSIFEHLKPVNTGKDNELWTVDAITKMVEAGERVLVERTTGFWMTTGDPENYFKAHVKFALDQEKYGAKIGDWLTELK